MKQKNQNVIPLNVPLTLNKHPHSPFYKSENVFNYYEKATINFFTHNGDEFFPFPIPMHCHEFYEINIVISGRGVHYINGGRVMANVGDVFIINPGLEHGYHDISNLQLFTVLIEKSFLEKNKDTLTSMDGYLSLFNIEPALRRSSINNAFLSLDAKQFKEIQKDLLKLEQYSETNIYNYNIQCSIIFALICKFCKFYHEKNILKKRIKKSKTYTPTIIFAIEYMKKNLDQPMTIDDVAKKVFLSRSTFIRYFTFVTNVSPLLYLTKLRIQHAKYMLEFTDKTITYIANDCGFFDSSHFEKVFTKHEGISPSCYRKTAQQKNEQNKKD